MKTRSDDFEQRLIKYMIDADMFSEIIEKHDDREGVSSTMADLGDIIHYAFEMLDAEDEEIERLAKLKKHQAGLVRKEVNFDAPRSMLGCYHGNKPYNG